MSHHASDTIADLQSKLAREDLDGRPLRLDVDPDAEAVLGFTFITDLYSESPVFASDGAGSRVAERNSRGTITGWTTDYVPEGWQIHSDWDDAHFLGGSLLEEMMDMAVNCWPEEYAILCVETAYIGSSEADDVDGWCLLYRTVDAVNVPVELTADQVRTGDGFPGGVCVKTPVGWPDVELDQAVTITTTDGLTFSGVVVSCGGSIFSIQADLGSAKNG